MNTAQESIVHKHIGQITADKLSVGMSIIDHLGRTLLVLSKDRVQELSPMSIGCNLPIHHYTVLAIGSVTAATTTDRTTTIQGNANARYRLLCGAKN